MSTVTQEIIAIKPDWSRRFEISLYLTVVGALLVTALYAPGVIRFWPFSVMEIVHRIAPLFLIALFIERCLEVFVTAWRGPDAAIRDHRIRQLRKTIRDRNADAEAEIELARVCAEKEQCRSRLRRVAFAGSVALGVIVSAVGVRALGLFVDPAAFSGLSAEQQASFNMVDVLLTGAMLGGGSDALHKFVTVFTNFMERTAKQAKGDHE
jgi:hypothetical protein